MNSSNDHPLKIVLLMAAVGAVFVARDLRAGDATWSLTPQSGDWYTAANWVPQTVPNGPDDVATLDGYSSVLSLTFPTGSSTVLDSMVINPAPFYRVTVGNGSSLTFVGTGAVLTMGVGLNHLIADAGGIITFMNSSSCGAGIAGAGTVSFHGNSVSNGNAGAYSGGVLTFSDEAKAIGSVNAITGGSVYFNDDTTAEEAIVGVLGDGFADISGHHAPGLAINQPSADGTFFLGANNLTITSTFRLSDFSGTFSDGGAQGGTGGSLTKAGPPDSVATLTGSSSYTGGTTISGGSLFVMTASHNATPTGSGDVHVDSGSFGGSSTVPGNVVVGTGTGTRASLIPTKRQRGSSGLLSIKRSLTFASDGVLQVFLNSAKGTFGRCAARGVVIASGAQIELSDQSGSKLATGTVLTVVSNSGKTPIAGHFANLIDGATITANSNTFQANYKGGDGNDLTLTVIN